MAGGDFGVEGGQGRRVACASSSMIWRLKRRWARADARYVIELHRLHNNGTFLVNPDLIETVEARPDTTITTVNKHHYVVADSVDDVIDRIIAFRARVAAATGTQSDHPAGARSLAAFDDHAGEQAA